MDHPHSDPALLLRRRQLGQLRLREQQQLRLRLLTAAEGSGLLREPRFFLRTQNALLSYDGRNRHIVPRRRQRVEQKFRMDEPHGAAVKLRETAVIVPAAAAEPAPRAVIGDILTS